VFGYVNGFDGLFGAVSPIPGGGGAGSA